MDSGEIEEVEKGAEKSGEYFSGGVEGDGRGRFKEGFFSGGGKKVIFDEEVDT